MRRVILAAWAALAPLTAMAQETAPVPEARIVVTRDTDLFGNDLQPLFDTTRDACLAACLNDTACGALTYNANNGACFPKSAAGTASDFAGALSGVKVATDPAVLARAADRAAALAVLGTADIARARDEAGALGPRHGGGAQAPADLARLAETAWAEGRGADAIHWTGAALAQTDSAALWLQYGAWSARHAARTDGAQRFAARALPAAVNAWLRSGPADERVAALTALARALEAEGRGRDSIAALRLAQTIAPRADTAAALDRARGLFGFRITGHDVEADLAEPRLCASFSEPLVRAGQDYAPFVRLPDPRLAVLAEAQRICVAGLTHGSRVTVTFRAGLPAADGEVLQDDVTITAYVRDRTPGVTFPGRAYVLPQGPTTGLPVQTVNTATLDLALHHVADANLVRALQEGQLARPLSDWDADRVLGTLAEPVWRGTAEVGDTLNRDVTTRLPLNEALQDRPAGVYILSAAVPGPEGARATQWFLLSDIGLSSLAGSDGLTVAARRLSDAQPMAGLEIALRNRANRVLARAATDADGTARFDPGLMRGTGTAAPALLTARDGAADMTFLSLAGPAFDLSDRGVAGREPAGPLDAFLATDRGAYRVGETIHATALLRDARARAVADVPLTATLLRPDGVEQARETSARGIAGGHVFALTLPDAAPRGTWTLALHADPAAPPLASQSLLVEDFVPERIDVTLDLPEGAIDPAAPPALGIAARYLFGAPGAGLPIEGDVTLTTRNALPGFPGYRFGRHDDPAETRRTALPAGRVTDAGGAATVPLPLPQIEAQGRPLQATATVRVAEASARPVERSVTRALAPQGPVIGIRPLTEGPLAEGATARFDLIGLSPTLAPLPMAVRWQLNRVRVDYQWYQLYGRWNWEPVTTRETIASGTALLGDAPVPVAAQVDWGDYELVVERTDGAYTAASVGFQAGWYAPADAADSPDMLQMSLDADRYRPGDTATLRVVPRAPGTALVSVLSDRVIAQQTVALPAGETLIPLPVTEAWGSGAYVTAQVIRPTAEAEGRVPVRALGLAHAAVDPGAQALRVRIDAPERVRPRGPLSGSVVVDGVAPGETAHVTLAAVDVGILNLTAHASPDPTAHYFGQRRLGVELRDLYGRLIDGRSGAMGRIRSGGDGVAALSLQAPPPTEATVTLFRGPVTVDAQGRAAFAFDMPDFAGTVRLMAVAWSATGVGQAEAEVLVRDPVAIAAAMPRFLAPGDESRLRLQFTHLEGPTGTMPVRVEALGAVTEADLQLSDGGQATLDVPLRAGVPGDYALSVVLSTPDGRVLRRDLTLGVRRGDPPGGTTRRLTLAPGETLTLGADLFAGLHADGAAALVSAGPLARFDAAGMMTALDRYPYGCTEQLTSRALPLLSLGPLAGPLGLGDAAAVAARVDGAIAQILTRQAAGGSFGLWSAGAGDFWLDAYVTDFLSRARAAGHAVPDAAFDQALNNLAARIAYAPDFERGGEDIAYALHVLAREGRAAMGDLRYYADQKAGAFGAPLALAQLGAALASYGDTQRADRLFAAAEAGLGLDLGPDADRDRWRADYGSARRDAAGILALAVAAGSQAVDRTALTARIAGDTAAASPQDRAWTLMAAAATGADGAGLLLDGAAVTGPLAQRIPAGTPRRLTNAGPAAVPVTLTTLGVPVAGTERRGFGYAIDRATYTLDGTPADGPLRVGDRRVVVLTVRPAEPARARLMIDDPLPAGLEIDNPSLLRAGDIAALDWLQTSDARHAEFRTDRFLAAVDQDGAAPIRLAYMVRAVSPGAFHHPAALVEDMYRPDYRATTAASRLEIAP